MPRLMSVTLTEQAVVERRKTVTRRLGWYRDKNGRVLLRVGDRLTLCRKVMGRKKGDPLVRLAEVEVVSVRRVPLCDISPDEIVREGVDPAVIIAATGGPWDSDTGQPDPTAWVRWFCDEMGVCAYDLVTRIEWRYLDEAAGAR